VTEAKIGQEYTWLIKPEYATLGRAAEKRFLAVDPEFIEDGENVRFRLTYEGELLSSSSKTPRATHKHEIRKKFHPQLKRLWEIEPNLLATKTYDKSLSYEEQNKNPLPGWVRLAHLYSRNDYHFVPLATKEDSLIASVEILFLRPDIPGGVLKSGDIDARLKTLFDALKMPSNADELGGYNVPADGEDPFFVLLEDDGLLSHVSIETDTLLEPTSSAKGQFLVNDARLVITVHLRPYFVKIDNTHFL
jgi:hypothetical protein